MRVLHLLHSMRRGGLERIVCSVANGLSRAGLPQAVCCLHADGPLLEALEPQVERFVLHARPNSPALPWRLRRVIRRFCPDVLHSADFCSWPDATLAGIATGRPARIHSFHGFLATPPRRWRLAGRWLARSTETLHAVSEELADEASRVYRIPRTRFQIVPNGVDVATFDPQRVTADRTSLGLPKDRFICVTLASLTPVKNPTLLVEVARRIDSAVTFVWVGDGPLRPQLTTDIQRHGLADRLKLVGPQDDVRPWLAAADAFVLPSNSEALPMSLLEALAMQVPVVATRTGSVEAVVNESGAGTLVEIGEVDGLVEAVHRLREAPAHRRVLGTRGRDYVSRHYSEILMLERYRRMYEQALSQRRPERHPALATAGGV